MIRRILLGLGASLLIVSSLSAQEWAQNLFAVREHNFGSIARGGKAEYDFVVTNNLLYDVHLASVRTSCGCTTPSIKDGKQTLKPYESGAILAHLNSDTHLGQRAATLTVTIDRPYYAEVQLQVRAYVHSNVLMEPSAAQFGAVSQGKAAETSIRLYRDDLPNWEITGVRFTDPNLKGEVVPVARQGSQTWYDLKVRLAPNTPPGYLHDHAILLTNDPMMAQMPVEVDGQVRSSVSVSPSDLFLGVLRTGETVTKPLIVKGDKPFRIKSIKGDKDAFVIKTPPSELSAVQVVPVTFVAGAETGKVVKTIHIETDLGPAQATSYAVVSEGK